MAAYFEFIPHAINIHVLDAASGAERFAPVNISGNPSYPQLQFTNDGHRLFVRTYLGTYLSSKMTVVSVDVVTGTHAFLPANTLSNDFALSPDGRFIVGPSPKHQVAAVLDAATFKQMTSVSGELSPYLFPFSANSRRVMLLGPKSRILYDTVSWNPIANFRPGEHDAVTHPMSDGSVLTLSNDHEIVIWKENHPKAWWGVVVLWQFWLVLLAAAAFVISATRDVWKWYHPTMPRRAGPTG